MIKNYFKIALRNLARHKGYAFINIFGLAVGLAACLIILAYVQFETSYDRFHSKADRIYRLENEAQNQSGRVRWSATLQPVGGILRDQAPEVESVTQIMIKERALVRYGEKRLYSDYFRYADPSFFDVFDFEILRGSKTSLNEPWKVFISQSAAIRYFGDEDPVGRVLDVSQEIYNEVETYEIVGVMADTPANSHVHIEFLASISSAMADVEDPWRRIGFTYVLLREGVTVDEVTPRLAEIEETFLPEWVTLDNFMLMPLDRIRLYAQGRGQIEPTGDIRYVYLFSAIALLIVVLACINYMNLATARSSLRAREVGVRKVVGADRQQLIFQFLGESFWFVGLGLIAAAVLAELSLPMFNKMLNSTVEIDFSNPAFVAITGAGAMIVALIAGSYPAFLLSGFSPSSVLKSVFRTRSGPILRKSLVVFQFAVSIGFVAATIVIYKQLDYIQKERLGFDQEQKLVLTVRGHMGDQGSAFKQELLRQAGIRGVTMSSSLPGSYAAFSFVDAEDIEGYRGDPEAVPVFDRYWVDYDFFDVLGLEFVEGRAFAASFPSDVSQALIVNEAAVRRFGWEEPLGKRITLPGGTQKQVIGVVKDFHVKTLREAVEPMIIEIDDGPPWYLAVAISPEQFAENRSAIEAIWNRFLPDLPFRYSFLEDDIAALYEAEQRMGRLFVLFAGLAIVVACLGLFGLAAFTIVQRTKEIGIRKTLGASTVGLIRLLSEDYLKLLAISLVVAIPIVAFAMQSWLDGFAYRIELEWWIFAAAGGLALFIALATVSYQSIKAVLANPVEALRYE